MGRQATLGLCTLALSMAVQGLRAPAARGRSRARATPRMAIEESIQSNAPPRMNPPSATPETFGGVNFYELGDASLLKPADQWRQDSTIALAYKECERITESFAKTFYLGTKLMTPEKAKATWAVYTWCRRTDDLVDSPRATMCKETMLNDIADWQSRLEGIFAGRPKDSLDAALVDTIKRFPSVDIGPFDDMVKGMLMDIPGTPLAQMRYETWDELKLYCYRVAGTVGLMTLPIMGTAEGYTEKDATEAALSLGIALQITNILRDVGEDTVRGRIYLPMEDLRRFGVSEEQIMEGVVDDNYKALIRFEIERANSYYEAAEAGIAMLHPDARMPVRASLNIYRDILRQLAENDYDNFRKRAYVSKFRKLLMLPEAWLQVQSVPKGKSG
eukprot:CAMPEP_0118878202 /NCGR_PEP_ID=MMETSP1163-20130328/18206_1 /TAXON_ID=124430 /ORGANISM="Phaeomonas parva, Strain CCMP2877" /LENGTH=387 /DNA_ID=CAMNT_0006814009 /DNA_START=124 /DNA_END=1287 /DNA_ORIENTATION=-